MGTVQIERTVPWVILNQCTTRWPGSPTSSWSAIAGVNDRRSANMFVVIPTWRSRSRTCFPLLVMLEDVRPVPRSPIGHFGQTKIDQPPSHLGEYRIVREIGRGGMGIVYEAEQESLGRRVALKVLPPGAFENARQVERFRREARAAARLHHTNIVPVFGVGQEGDTHYYVMQHIEGRPLDDVLGDLRRLRAHGSQNGVASEGDPSTPENEPLRTADRNPARLPTSADLARALWDGQFRDPSRSDVPGMRARTGTTQPITLRSPLRPSYHSPLSVDRRRRCRTRTGRTHGAWLAWVFRWRSAFEYSAGQGVLHRDVKPSNLILDVFGTVWLTDFGLAKATDTPDLTHTGDLFGTLRYLAPERFRGQADVRSDVYALGLTLYEMLAMRPAFDDHGEADLVGQITRARPPSLDEIDSSLPRDLVTIVHKAIAKDPADRYQTPGALADDLRCFLDDRPIAARQLVCWRKCWRWCRRNPTDAALVATILRLVGLAIGMGIWVQRQQAEQTGGSGRARGTGSPGDGGSLEQAASLLHEGRWPEAKAVLMQADGWLHDARSHDLPQRLERARADLDLVDKLEGTG